jgi:hypothetical protein
MEEKICLESVTLTIRGNTVPIQFDHDSKSEGKRPLGRHRVDGREDLSRVSGFELNSSSSGYGPVDGS